MVYVQTALSPTPNPGANYYDSLLFTSSPAPPPAPQSTVAAAPCITTPISLPYQKTNFADSPVRFEHVPLRNSTLRNSTARVNNNRQQSLFRPRSATAVSADKKLLFSFTTDAPTENAVVATQSSATDAPGVAIAPGIVSTISSIATAPGVVSTISSTQAIFTSSRGGVVTIFSSVTVGLPPQPSGTASGFNSDMHGLRPVTSAVLAGSLCGGLVLLIAIIFLGRYHKRRQQRLREQLAARKVQAPFNPLPSNDRSTTAMLRPLKGRGPIAPYSSRPIHEENKNMEDRTDISDSLQQSYVVTREGESEVAGKGYTPAAQRSMGVAHLDEQIVGLSRQLMLLTSLIQTNSSVRPTTSSVTSELPPEYPESERPHTASSDRGRL